MSHKKYVPDFSKYAFKESATTRSEKASDILSYGIESTKSFYELFETERAKRGAKGGHTTNAEQDLLRSMLVFSAATLDSVVKQVLKDQIPNIGSLPEQAQEMFEEHVAKQLTKGAPVNVEALTSALLSPNPRQYFIDEYVKALTGDSLQSRGQVMKAAAAIGVALNLKKGDFEDLDALFDARNEIIHELDYLISKDHKKQRSRRNRNRQEIIRWAERLLGISHSFLKK